MRMTRHLQYSGTCLHARIPACVDQSQFISASMVVFQNGGAKDGYDMNVAPAWKRGYTGKGVVVSILDDGIQTNHPDLALNYVSYTYV